MRKADYHQEAKNDNAIMLHIYVSKSTNLPLESPQQTQCSKIRLA